MDAYQVTEADLAEKTASERVSDLIKFEADRARRLLDDGAPLVGTLRGTARLAVAGYVAGGRAALVSIAAAGYDVLSATPTPAHRRVATELLRAVVTGR